MPPRWASRPSRPGPSWDASTGCDDACGSAAAGAVAAAGGSFCSPGSGPPWEACGSTSPVGSSEPAGSSTGVRVAPSAGAPSPRPASSGASGAAPPSSAGAVLSRAGSRPGSARRPFGGGSLSGLVAASSGDDGASFAARAAGGGRGRRAVAARIGDRRLVGARGRGHDRRARLRPARERARAGQRRQVHAAQHVADRAGQVVEVRHHVLRELVDPHALHGGGHHHAGEAGARLADVERVHRLARAELHLLGQALEAGLAAGGRRIAAEAVAERRVREQPLDQLGGDL